MHFKNICALFEYQGLPAPENPLLGMIQFNSCSPALINKEVSYGFFIPSASRSWRAVNSGTAKQSMTVIRVLCISSNQTRN